LDLLVAAGRVWRLPRYRLLLGLLAFAAVTVVTLLIGHPRIFTGFASYDDEGYMLIALKSFLSHGHLYDDVLTQYGPFYYEFWGGFFEIFSIPVDHDGGRTATLIAWVLAALLFGLATWRMTRSLLLGLATQILVFGAISTVTNEPMHPGGIICLLLGAIVALSCFVRQRLSPMAMALLGGAVMALVLVKVNVGAFALVSLALVCVGSYPKLGRRRWLRPAIELIFVAVPLLLMASKLGEGWTRHYVVHVSAAAFAVVVALRAREARSRPGEELYWLLGGLTAVGIAVCAAIIASGTSPGGLVEGVIQQPLRQSDAFSLALGLANRTYLFDLLGVTSAISYWYFLRRRTEAPGPAFLSLVSVGSIVIGLEMALSTIGMTALFEPVAFSGYQFAFLAFAWVALIPLGRDKDEETSFSRLLLPPLAVLQALHAFPVAGSQVPWSTFLLIPVGALCVANGVSGVAGILTEVRERRVIGALAVAVAAVMMIVLVNTQLRQPLKAADAAYDERESLGLPGAGDVRLSPEEAGLYRQVTKAIDADCRSLLMLPGMNSFYLWAEREPPTGYNATAWSKLFDKAHQDRVIDQTSSIKQLCLLENGSLARFWTRGDPPEGPLVSYLHRGFRPLVSFGDYRLLRREGARSAS
jgi:hypothetical protein